MDIANKLVEVFLGISITGMFSTIIWLLKWCDRLDLETHDLRRDVAHLQRNGQTMSQAISESDIQDEARKVSLQKYLVSIDRRLGKCETRIYVIEVRVNIPQAQE